MYQVFSVHGGTHSSHHNTGVSSARRCASNPSVHHRHVMRVPRGTPCESVLFDSVRRTSHSRWKRSPRFIGFHRFGTILEFLRDLNTLAACVFLFTSGDILKRRARFPSPGTFACPGPPLWWNKPRGSPSCLPNN